MTKLKLERRKEDFRKVSPSSSSSSPSSPSSLLKLFKRTREREGKKEQRKGNGCLELAATIASGDEN